MKKTIMSGIQALRKVRGKLCFACDNNKHSLCKHNPAECECPCWRI